MIYLFISNLILLNIIQLYNCQEIKLTTFRESFCSIRATKTAEPASNFVCENLKIKLVTSLKDSSSDWIIKPACVENFARFDLNFEDYITDHDRIFADSINFKAILQDVSGDTITELINVEENNIQVKPGTVKKLIKTESTYKLEVDIIYRCQGYNGYNCNFKELDNPFYKRDPATKKSYCLDATGTNCGDQRCPTPSTINCGQGTCYVQTFGDQSEYCVCNSGHYGANCEKTFAKPSLTEDILLFAAKADLGQSQEGTDCGAPCQACIMYGKFKICTELTIGSAKYECTQTDCDETCGEHFCRKKIGNGDPIYYEKKLSKKYGITDPPNMGS